MADDEVEQNLHGVDVLDAVCRAGRRPRGRDGKIAEEYIWG